MRVRRASVAGIAAALVAALTQTLVGLPAGEAAIAQPNIVSSNPADFTPYVLDGSVRAIVQSGNRIIVGGTFTQVKEVGTGKPTLTRNNLFSFDATTGVVDTAFAPNVNGLVASLVVSADGKSVYVGGAYTTIGGVGPRSIARLNISNGARTPGFSPPIYNSEIKDLKVVGNVLFTAGVFSVVGSTVRPALATLDATTGVLTTASTVSVTGVHNGGTTQILKIDVSPAGDRLVAIGNFTQINGVNRNQFATFSITPTSTTLSWYTPFYEATCASAFNSYMRDVDFSPDGSYFVVSTTGGYGGSTGPCDQTARFETYSNSGESVMPSWRDYTGGDTTYAIAVTGSAVYAGGHQRWQNNPYASNQAGPGAVSRPGIVALDPVNGLPFSWNPTRDTGVGVFDFLVTATGLWVGNDTLNIGGEYHPRLAFFPLSGGTGIPANITGSLSNDVYLTGRKGASSKPSVLYRINAGGPALSSLDDGPDWAADNQSGSALRNSGSNAAGGSPVPSVDANVPNSDTDRAPRSLFDTERWDPSTAPEMTWSLPVPVGARVQVRAYFANRYSGTANVGDRVFNVDLNGTRVLNDYDIVADVGHNKGTMKSWNVTSTGTVTLAFGHVKQNPLVNGIEVVRVDLPPGPVSTTNNDVQRRYFTGSFSDPSVVLSNTGPDWGNSRGSMLIDGTVYYAASDGKFYATSFDGTTFATPTAIDLYGGYFGGEAASVTGMFFSGGRMYFTLAGDNTLHYRYFTPESRVVGAIRYDASGDMVAFGGARVSGMFLSGGRVYFGDASTGNLLSMSFVDDSLRGSVSVADSLKDWRSRGMFVWNGTPSPRTGVPPNAMASVHCTFLTCSFEGSGSNDPDGSVVAYSWNFADSGTSTLSSVDHTFAAAGTYSVTLTVTDDAGQTGTVTTLVTVKIGPNQLPTAVAAVSCTYLTCTIDASRSTDGDGYLTSYAWDLGDAQSSLLSSDSHVFASDGTYTITLTVTDDRGGTDTDTTTVTVAANTAPTAVVGVTCTYLVCANSGSGSSDTEGPISYAWDFGDGQTSSATAPPHTYSTAGTYTVGLTVMDGGGLTASASQQVTVTAPSSTDPVARASVNCTYLVCSYDGSTSTDDGTIASYLWDFGDSATSSAVSGSYTYPVGGSYTVKLTVTDDHGDTNTATVPVTVLAVTSPIAFVGSRDVQANAINASIQASAATQVGHAMLLFVTTNTTATVTNLTGGWTFVGERVAGDATPDLRTRLYSKVATASDAGATSSLTLSAISKVELTMLVYSGTDPAAPVAAWSSAKETATTATHTGPSVALTDPRSWAVSYWADKTNASTGWITPAGSTLRAASVGTGSGRVAALAVDNAGPVGVGSTFTGVSAVSSVATYKATMWTVILKPAP